MLIENLLCRFFVYLVGGNGGLDGDCVCFRRYFVIVFSKLMMGVIWLLLYLVVIKNNDLIIMRDIFKYFSDWLSGFCLWLMMKVWVNIIIILKISIFSDSQIFCDDLVGIKFVFMGGKLMFFVVLVVGGVLIMVFIIFGCVNKQVVIKLSRMMMLVFMY